MTRPRHIDREALLDATARVIVRDGTSRLTLDAVATEAGISKASVIYDCKTKQGLLRDLIVSRVEQYRRKREAAMEKISGSSDALVLAAIELLKSRTQDERALFTAISDAIARDPDLLAPVHQLIREEFAQAAEAKHSRGMRLAMLALSGLEEAQRLGGAFSAEEYDRVLGDIVWLSNQDPEPVDAGQQ